MHGDRLRTGISEVRWCNPAEGFYKFDPAVVKEVMTDKAANKMCWFDELFRGGILLPAKHGNRKRAVTLLITGPPGTGKSTLAMELCVRLATDSGIEILGGKTLYVASEAYPQWMVDNATSFGWQKDRQRTEPLFDIGAGPRKADISICTLSDVEAGNGSIFETLRDVFRLNRDANIVEPVDPTNLGVVVVDSLNSVEHNRSAEFDKLYKRFVEGGPRLIIFVLDSAPSRPVAETWEFAADIVLRLDKEYDSGYMIRTVEIVKARYQPHVWGKHQLKIYEAQARKDAPPERLSDPKEQEQRLRAHPWARGGIFIFPSIHFILSRYKRVVPEEDHKKTTIETPLPSLNKLLGQGIPRGRTTALLGGRGTHKSHLGYLQALHNVLKLKGKSIIISLRDDEAMTMDTLEGILKQHWPKKTPTLKSLLNSGTLEVVYYMPGYVTPEEFFHRMLLSIYRMRESDAMCEIMLLFNSLDQIASRFPLCVREKVFVPGIIQTLAAIGVTSIFVGADTEGIDEGLRDLLSMAELIIKAERIRDYSKENFEKILPNAETKARKVLSREKFETALSELPPTFPITQLTVERYAGGRPAGSQGMLELVTKDSLAASVLAPGLQFIPYRAMHGPSDDKETTN